MLDPYQFLAEFIEDTVPPQAHAFMAIPQEDGLFNGGHARSRTVCPATMQRELRHGAE